MSDLRSGRINRIARLIGARRYLEVGVCRGTTFFAVDVAEKVAVDPVFQFDHRATGTATSTFHQTTSDDFFAGSSSGRFDLIYLDGLHTFEQCLRDFLNSLRFAHAHTVWIIDDTVPNDQYAALPDERECFRFRHATGNMDWSWMGDVYKVVFFIGSLMKDFEFYTFAGHGQTVLWRPPSSPASRTSIPLEEITGLSWNGMLEHMSKMRPASDEEIFAAVSAFAKAEQTGRLVRSFFHRISLAAARALPRKAGQQTQVR